MPKGIKIAAFAAIVLLLTTSLYTLYAQGQGAGEGQRETITLQDLGVETVGLLPTNPFYFVKEFGRGLKRLLAIGVLQKAQLELDVVNEKAAEIKKLEDIGAENNRAIARALENYVQSTERLAGRMHALIGRAEGAFLHQLINSFVERALNHQRLFDDIAYKLDARSTPLLREAEERLSELFAFVPAVLEEPASFGMRVRHVLATEERIGLVRMLEALERLSAHLDVASRQAVLVAAEDALLEVSGLLEAGDEVVDFQGLSGDPFRRLQVLDEVRERVQSSEAKSALNVLRQRMLEAVQQGTGITQERADAAIQSAADLLADLEKAISDAEGAVSASVSELRERAQFNLEQASVLYDQGNFGGAFGQAIAASAAAQNALTQLALIDTNFAGELTLLKKRVDDASATARLSPAFTADTELSELLGEAQRRIAELSDVVQKNASAQRIIPLLRTTKVLVAMIETRIGGGIGDSQ